MHLLETGALARGSRLNNVERAKRGGRFPALKGQNMPAQGITLGRDDEREGQP